MKTQYMYKRDIREAYCSLKRSKKRYYSYFVPKRTLSNENNRFLLCPDSYFAHRQFPNRTDFCTFLERPIIDFITLGVRLMQLHVLELEASIL